MSLVLSPKLKPKFEIFTAMKIQVMIFCFVTPCSEVAGYQRFGTLCFLHLQVETLVSYHIITRCQNTEDHDLNNRTVRSFGDENCQMWFVKTADRINQTCNLTSPLSVLVLRLRHCIVGEFYT